MPTYLVRHPLDLFDLLYLPSPYLPDPPIPTDFLCDG